MPPVIWRRRASPARAPGSAPPPAAPPARAPAGPLLRSISVYRSSPGAKKTRLQHFFAPERSPVLSLACTPRSLCAGLVGGAVAVYAKAEGNGARVTACAASRGHR